MNLSGLEQANLARQLAYVSERVSRLESLLQGQPIGTARINDAAITNAKIDSVAANKIDAETLSAISAKLGNVQVGAIDNEDGVLTIRDADDNIIITLDKDGIVINSGTITVRNKDNEVIIDEFGLNSNNTFTSGSVSGSGTQALTSTSFVTLTGLEITFTLPRSQKVLLFARFAAGSLFTSTVGYAIAVAAIDGDDDDNLGDMAATGSRFFDSSVLSSTDYIQQVRELEAGSHTLRLRARRSTGGDTAITAALAACAVGYVVLGN